MIELAYLGAAVLLIVIPFYVLAIIKDIEAEAIKEKSKKDLNKDK